MDKNCLSTWYPLLVDAGLPVPRTEIIRMTEGELAIAADCVCAGNDRAGELKDFFRSIDDAAVLVGYPCFLRTGQTSGKHEWSKTCLLPCRGEIANHVFSLIEFSEMAMLPWNVWCVRELLPAKPLAICDRYGGMPVCREWRFFVQGGSVQCVHPYWPLRALQEGMTDQARAAEVYEILVERVPDWTQLLTLARRAGLGLEGYWSVDLLETERGWYVTDAAEGVRSYHDPDCRYCPEDQLEQEKRRVARKEQGPDLSLDLPAPEVCDGCNLPAEELTPVFLRITGATTYETVAKKLCVACRKGPLNGKYKKV